MASSINAATAGAGGVITTADNSGVLNLQSGGTTVATVSSTGFSTPTGQTINTANTFGFKNRIINGGMTIDQRNAGASVTPTDGQFTLDRWISIATAASKFSIQQNAGSVSTLATGGFSNYLGITSLSAYSVAAGDIFGIQQRIEGFNSADLQWGTANAKTITLSAWVYSSLTGTFGGALINSAQNYSYPFTYTISSANTWTQISVTIAGPTAGTWVGATNGSGIQVNFGIGAGSTYSGTAGAWAAQQKYTATGATSVVGTSGATFYITGVQLEVGSQATSFDFRSFGTELSLCQRYYQKTYDVGTTPGTNTSNSTVGAYAYSGAQATGGFYFRVSMRTTPTVTLYSTIGTSGRFSIPGNVDSGAMSAIGTGQNSFPFIDGSGLQSGSIAYGHFTASAEL